MPAGRLGREAKNIRLQAQTAPTQEAEETARGAAREVGRAGSISPIKCDRRVKWSTEEYIAAHREVVRSGLHNFQGCKIPIPTKIRFDRMRAALGNEVTSKELKMLDLLKYGMPLNCKPGYGISKPQ